MKVIKLIISVINIDDDEVYIISIWSTKNWPDFYWNTFLHPTSTSKIKQFISIFYIMSFLSIFVIIDNYFENFVNKLIHMLCTYVWCVYILLLRMYSSKNLHRYGSHYMTFMRRESFKVLDNQFTTSLGTLLWFYISSK